MMELDVQTRDPKTLEHQFAKAKIDPKRTAVVIVDPWNYHWCMTACERVGAMTPRWNAALDGARRLGMRVAWAPSDVVGSYYGTPQREAALAVKIVPVPRVRDLSAFKFTVPVGSCMCGPGLSCATNYGHDAMNPALRIDESDWIISDTGEIYSLLKERGIVSVIYMGLHTNMCLYGKPGALKFLYEAGMDCFLCRDINDAFTRYDPENNYTPDRGTREIDDQLEQAGIRTIDMARELSKAGAWGDNAIVETVRITPWGKPGRPFFFEKEVKVSLNAPWLDDVEIHYTTNGQEPTAQDPICQSAISVSETTTLKTAAFRRNARVSLTTDAYFARLPEKPPLPSIYLDELQYQVDPYAAIAPVYAACFWMPRVGKSFEGNTLRLRGVEYQKGLGMRAPAGARYFLKPEWKAFVGLAGVDDRIIDIELGRNLAARPSVIFKVMIDGRCAAQSDVMRISQEPWRFNVPIPSGSRQIHLVCVGARENYVQNYGNWVNAGFIA